MRYVKVNGDNIEYPYDIENLRREYRNVSFPDVPDENTLNKYNVFVVYETPIMNVDDKHTTKEIDPVCLNGVWRRQYETIVIPMPDIDSKEHQRQSIIMERNRLLQSTDWTQGRDIPIEISDRWAVYRQQLRDITKQPSFPQTVKWPIPPL